MLKYTIKAFNNGKLNSKPIDVITLIVDADSKDNALSTAKKIEKREQYVIVEIDSTGLQHIKKVTEGIQ